MESCTARLSSLLEDFSTLGSWTMRFNHICDLGNEVELLAPQARHETTLVRSCSSPLWFGAWVRNEAGGLRLCCACHSEALIPKGLAGLLYHLFDGCDAQECYDFFCKTNPGELATSLGLPGNISSTRLESFIIMASRVRDACSEPIQGKFNG